MYGEIRIKVGNDWVYRDILNIDYEIDGKYIPAILYPTDKCREAEYPEMMIKAIIIENVDNFDYTEASELEIISLDIDIEPCEYSTEYKIDRWYIKNSITILEVE